MASVFSSAIAAAAPLKPEIVLQKPLVIGASVSGDTGTLSPGKRLALRYTSKENIRTIARGGTPGSEIFKLLNENDLRDRSCVLAIDMFFWDSTRTNVEESLMALHRLVEMAKKNHLPLMLGEIPELLRGFQPQRPRLNEEIARQCRAYDLCRVMPFEKLYLQLLRNGYLEAGGRRLHIREIVPDGLHLSQAASEFLATTMLHELTK